MDYYKNAIDILEKYSENTAIEIIKKLKPEDQEILAKQILKTNFEQIEEVVNETEQLLIKKAMEFKVINKVPFEVMKHVYCIDDLEHEVMNKIFV